MPHPINDEALEALYERNGLEVVETPEPQAEPEVIQPQAQEVIEVQPEAEVTETVEQPEAVAAQPEVEVSNDIDIDFDIPAATPQVESESFIKKHEAKIKELGFEVKDEVEFFEKIQSKLKETVTPTFADPIINEANELAKLGINWSDYMAFQTTDFTKVSNEDILKSQMSNQLKWDAEKIENALSELTPTQIEMQAAQYRQSLLTMQQAEKQKVEGIVKQQRESYERGINDAFRSMDKVAGVTVKPEHKEVFIAKLRSKSFEQLYLHTDGKLDPTKVAEAAFKIEAFNRVSDVARQRGENKGKASVIESLSNVAPIDKPTVNAAPQVNTKSKMEQFLEEQLEGLS